MNTFRYCLFVGLFALVAPPVFAAPGAATLIAPSGDVVGTTLAFSWQAVPESSWYLFWLGRGTPTDFVMEQWYSAEQAGCANGGTCTITITPPMNAGSHVWFIRTWGAGLDGPWSTGKQFILKDPLPNWSSTLPAARRFTVVLNGEGVLDNETGLVWLRTQPSALLYWFSVQINCVNVSAGGRGGWRMPTVSELKSLVDQSRANPALPAGHPFIGIGTGYVWSQTLYHATSDVYYAVEFGTGQANGYTSGTNTHRYWCVHAPSAGGQ